MDSKSKRNRSFIKRIKRDIFLAAVFIFLTAIELTAGVLVAPTSIILSDKKRTGRLTVQNPSDKPKEVTISFSFGLPESDSLGNVQIRLQDTSVTDPQSSLGWIKAFPRKMVLQPNSSQIIRFVARPPKDLPDGEYWCRVVVKSQSGETSIPVPSDNDKITTKLNMIMQTAIICKYRTGNLISKLDVTETDINLMDTTVNVRVSMANRGNVSYVGVLTARLLDAENKEIFKRSTDLAVYRELTRRMELPITGRDFAQPYHVEIIISNEGRTDIPPEDMVVGNSIEYTTLVE